jgi:hypothetical protein
MTKTDCPNALKKICSKKLFFRVFFRFCFYNRLLCLPAWPLRSFHFLLSALANIKGDFFPDETLIIGSLSEKAAFFD